MLDIQIATKYIPYQRLLEISMATRKTSVAIDEALFDDVRAILGTATLRETVEEAFLRVRREQARREEVDALATMRGMDLDKPRIMAKAWRT